MADYLDLQLLIYVPKEQYLPCIRFYEDVFGVTAFYGWDEGEEDRGKKYDIAGTKLVILTQENPFPEYGPLHFQIQVPDVARMYARLENMPDVNITQGLFTRPYGWRMFRLADPAGNHINIYEIPNT